MAAENPPLVSLAILLREDGRMLFVRHSDGPFAGRWSMPLAGVAGDETAEETLERILRQQLHIEPGPYEFLDTIYLDGAGGERFIGNAFTCVEWRGEARVPPAVYDDALWAPPGATAALELLPAVRDWIAAAFEAEGQPAAASYDVDELRAELVDARGDVIAAFDANAFAHRGEPRGDWTALDVLAHVADVEAYYIAETRRLLAEPGRTWRMFNEQQWDEARRLRALEDEGTLRERLARVRSETLAWLRTLSPESLAAYGNHPERGVVQVGDRIAKVAHHDREHAEQLRRMAAQSESPE